MLRHHSDVTAVVSSFIFETLFSSCRFTLKRRGALVELRSVFL